MRVHRVVANARAMFRSVVAIARLTSLVAI
jgi:hypothetical protein